MSFFSDIRISDRLDEIDKWRKTLEYSIQDIDREIQAIQSAKAQCERYLEHMRSPLGIIFSTPFFKRKVIFSSDVSLENYVTRDGRKAIDNVDDEAERELKKVYHSFSSGFILRLWNFHWSYITHRFYKKGLYTTSEVRVWVEM